MDIIVEQDAVPDINVGQQGVAPGVAPGANVWQV